MDLSSLTHLIWILPLLLLVVYVGSPRFLGTMGSTRVRRLLDAGLEKSRYTIMHDVNLPAGGGTIHVDHILVSQLGIHVIASIHKSGWITGTEVQERWRSKTLGRWRHFDNPVHATYLQAQALARLLQLPVSRFHILVVFSGHLGFKNTTPPKVVSPNNLISKIRADSRQILTPEEANLAILNLQNSVLKPVFPGRAARWKFVRFVLLMVLLGSIYWVYGESLRAALGFLQQQANVSMSPEKFHTDGKAKSETELWEDSLICAYSEDTQRCACYQPSGSKAEIGLQKCRDLAERGSVLRN